jgi:hypothetical protein
VNSFNKLVHYYLVITGYDERAFAIVLNEVLTAPGVNGVTVDEHIVKNWAYFDIEPSDTYFKAIIMNFPPGAQDWRVEFAFCALAILRPELFDLDGGRMWGLAERIVKFQILHTENAKAVIAKVLEAEGV